MNRPIKSLGEIALRTGRLEDWRSLYINDPDGNVVEWVCYDETVG